jgi:hypothetical protein
MSAKPFTPEQYIRFRMFAISGWLRSLDARIIASILAFQDDNNIYGNLCEIGVHHGRLFFMLALARRSDERSLAVDLFEDDAINSLPHHHRGRDRALVINARRLGISLSEGEIYKTSSLDIKAGDILIRTGGPIRFFSVDGGHNYENVENDLSLAKVTLSKTGIIAVDDYFNPDWPEVTFATYDFLKECKDIIPFILSPGKVYLAPPHLASTYQLAVRKANPNVSGKMMRFLNHEVYSMRYSLPRWACVRARDFAVGYGLRVIQPSSASAHASSSTG